MKSLLMIAGLVTVGGSMLADETGALSQMLSESFQKPLMASMFASLSPAAGAQAANGTPAGSQDTGASGSSPPSTRSAKVVSIGGFLSRGSELAMTRMGQSGDSLSQYMGMGSLYAAMGHEPARPMPHPAIWLPGEQRTGLKRPVVRYSLQ